MVVQCPTCQSKFRIADEKVTDSGVRVRCTSCKNVFQARRPAAGAEPAGTTLDLTSVGAAPVGKAVSRTPAAVRPVPPRAAATRPAARGAESAARRLEADDLFGMAELTGDAPLPPLPHSSAVTKPVLRPEAAFGDLDLDFVATGTPSLGPALPPPPPQDVQEEEPGKDERSAREPDPSGTNGAPAMADDFDLGFGHPQASSAAPAKAAEPAERSAPRAAEPAGPAAPRAAEPARTAEPEAAPGRALLSSALTGVLAAALAIAVGIGSALSGGRAGWLGLAARAEVVATRVVSGLYDTAGGRPVFFVRGRVENRSGKVHGPVRVTAELVAENGLPVRAEATAGAEPSAEEVWSLRTAADVERLGRSLDTGDRKLEPGGSLPFFAIIADPPADLRRHRLRVSVETLDGRKASSPGAKDQ
ncbi:MAG TPA: zinc-ribbon domain-containing protein [Myxococcales bacterium]|nr:zinc-ribbon domain-containing protein [Myxococcales bacterium]